MKVDYESYTIYFTEEEISLFDLKKPIKIARYSQNYSDCFLCFSQKKGLYTANIKENSTITIENNNINITSIYSITDYNFFVAFISPFGHTIKYKKNLETHKIDIDLFERINLETYLKTEHLSLITNINIDRWERKINTIQNYTHGFRIPNKFLPLNYLKTIKYPFISYNKPIFSIFNEPLKANPLFISIELDNNVNFNEELSIINSVRLLSIHKYREYYFDKNNNLLVNPLNNLNKTFSKMFENPSKIIEHINKILNIQKSNSFEIVSDDKIIDYYMEENYYEKKGDLGSSCMRYSNCKDKLKFYVYEPNISLLVLKLDDKVLGRAVLWTTVSGEIIMDRIYCCYESLNKLFIEYAEKNNISFIYNYKERCKNTTGYGPSSFRSELNKNFKIKLNDDTLKNISLEFKNPRPVRETSFKTLPYLDNFYYLDTVNGYLATNASYIEESNIVYVENKNSYYDISKTLFYEEDQYYYLLEDCVITNLNVLVPKVYCFNYENIYYLTLDCERIGKTSKSSYNIAPREFCTLIINPKNQQKYYVLTTELELFLKENPNYIVYKEYKNKRVLNLLKEIQTIEQI